MRRYNIPIFVPHVGCPHDCVFCNQRRITGIQKPVGANDARKIIDEHLRTIPKRNRCVEAAFFGGSFTGIPMEEQKSLLSVAKEYLDRGMIDGIRLSTRPDYINREILDNLERYGVTAVEMGVQSMDDEVLGASNRGHSASDVRKAAKLMKEYPFELGMQMMTGLPMDTPEKSLSTAEEIIKLRPASVRIYPTLTIKDTYLEKMYREGRYSPQTLDEAVELAKKLILRFEAENIKIIRVGLQSTDEISENGSVVAGPVHSSFRELAESSIYYDIMADALLSCNTDSAVIYVNSHEISKAVSNKRLNIRRIKENMNIDIKICADDSLDKREVRYRCC